MDDLSITLLQSELVWHQPARNRRAFEAKIAGLDDTDVIVLPEMFSTGFTMSAKDMAEPMTGETLNWLREMAQSRSAIITGSLIVTEHGRYYNRLIWVEPGGDLKTYDKRHLFRMAEEHHHYAAGSDKLLVDIKGWRVCPLICYDLRFPVWSSNPGGCDLIIYVANWPSARRDAWMTLLRARAIENLCYVVGVNRVGLDGNDVAYCGDSLVVDCMGNQQLHLGDNEATGTAVLSAELLADWRREFPSHLDADEFSIDRRR